MGHIYKLLGEAVVPPAPEFYKTRLVVELCENIHIHHRNMRTEFSRAEFLRFADVMTRAAKELRK